MSEALFERELKAVAKSGKLSLGARRAMKLLLKNQAKGIIVAVLNPGDSRILDVLSEGR